MLSKQTVADLMTALANQSAGNEVATAINNNAWGVAALIIAAHVSATTDFGALLIGDYLVHIPATAGNAAFELIAAAGTKPSAAVVGDMYIALRSSANAVKSVAKL